jgi:uncharacterized protein with GYD domain
VRTVFGRSGGPGIDPLSAIHVLGSPFPEEEPMAKYMVTASYTAEGAKGVMKDGGSGRRAAVQKLLESVGGKLEAFYFAFGKNDAIVIADLPDASAALAISMTVNATGAVHASTVQLFTPEEVDAAAKKTIAYRAPGA